MNEAYLLAITNSVIEEESFKKLSIENKIYVLQTITAVIETYSLLIQGELDGYKN